MESRKVDIDILKESINTNLNILKLSVDKKSEGIIIAKLESIKDLDGNYTIAKFQKLISFINEQLELVTSEKIEKKFKGSMNKEDYDEIMETLKRAVINLKRDIEDIQSIIDQRKIKIQDKQKEMDMTVKSLNDAREARIEHLKKLYEIVVTNHKFWGDKGEAIGKIKILPKGVKAILAALKKSTALETEDENKVNNLSEQLKAIATIRLAKDKDPKKDPKEPVRDPYVTLLYEAIVEENTHKLNQLLNWMFPIKPIVQSSKPPTPYDRNL